MKHLAPRREGRAVDRVGRQKARGPDTTVKYGHPKQELVVDFVDDHRRDFAGELEGRRKS